MVLLHVVVAGLALAASAPGVAGQFAENGVGPNENNYNFFSKGMKYLTYTTTPAHGWAGSLTSVNQPGVYNNYTIDLQFSQVRLALNSLTSLPRNPWLAITKLPLPLHSSCPLLASPSPIPPMQDALMMPPNYNGTWQRPCDDPCPYPSLYNATQADVDKWYWSWYQNETIMHPLTPANLTLDEFQYVARLRLATSCEDIVVLYVTEICGSPIICFIKLCPPCSRQFTFINKFDQIGKKCNEVDQDGDGIPENQYFCQFTFAEPKLFCLQV